MAAIIDAHIHLFLRENEEQNMIAAMDDAGIERSLLLPLPRLRFRDACTAGNEEVCDLARRHPDRFSFGVFADPRDDHAVDTIRRFVGLGAKVFKLFPPIGFYPDDPACMEVYETLAELKIPVLSHTGATSMTYWDDKPRSSLSSQWADPIRFDGLSRKFPEITWILAHMGMPWSLNAWFVSFANANVYLDIAGGKGWMPIVPYLWRGTGGVFSIDFNRVIWGSDNCLPPVEHIPFAKTLLDELGCDERYYPAVFGETAKRIFDLPSK